MRGRTLLLAICLCLAAGDCPVTSCGYLGYNVCATFSGLSLNLNQQNCTAGLHCSVFETYHWAKLRMDAGDEEGTLWCSQDAYTPPQAISDASQVTCGSRDKGQTLKDGSYPKRCASAIDCELVNGEYSNCECAMDGVSYCVIEWGSAAMDGFWSACSNATNLISASDFQHWGEYRKLYNLDKTKPGCAAALFDEFQFLVSSATAMVCGVLVGLFA